VGGALRIVWYSSASMAQCSVVLLRLNGNVMLPTLNTTFLPAACCLTACSSVLPPAAAAPTAAPAAVRRSPS
jgi:hypothetical protein